MTLAPGYFFGRRDGPILPPVSVKKIAAAKFDETVSVASDPPPARRLHGSPVAWSRGSASGGVMVRSNRVASLLFQAGPNAGRRYKLGDGDYIIGRRSDCQIFVPDMR